MKVAVILVLGLVAIMAFHAEARCSSTRPIRRVYVIRRGLKLVKSFTVPRYCILAHSGLIIEMTDGRQCVLEYLGDGKAHLYDARPSSTRNCWFQSCKVLKMKDESGTKYKWTRQKYGTAWPSRTRTVTPQVAQRQMQSLMGRNNYDLTTNNCHMGQERLRRKWGMRVAKPYTQDMRRVCSCKLPTWLPSPTLNSLLVLVRRYCN